MIESKTKKSVAIMMITYLVMFYGLWTVYALVISPYLDEFPTIIRVISKNLSKLLLWTLPVVIQLKYIYKNNLLDYLKLDKNISKGFIYGAIFGALITLYIMYRKVMISGGLSFNLLFDINAWIGAVLLVGFTEEVVFRGFILQKFEEIMNFKMANIITSILFVFIHFPRWIQEGNFSSYTFIINSALFLIIFSYTLGVMLKKTGSLWSCIIFHAANNFAMFAFNL